MNLGHKMRHMRQVRGLTAVALAKHARVTTGFISQLEHSQTVPSLQTLQRVAAALDVSLTYFLLEEDRQPRVVRKQARHSLPLEHHGARLWLLSPLPAQHLEVALLELLRGAVFWSTACAHEGQQCHLVLQGTVRADYGDTTYRLEEGDSILWDGAMPHRLENIGNNEAQLLIAMAPASLWKHAGEEAHKRTSTPGQVDRLSTEMSAPKHRQHKAVEDFSPLDSQLCDGLMQSLMASKGENRGLFSYKQVKERHKLLLAMTGLTPAEFELLCCDFEKAWNEFVRHNSLDREGHQRSYRGGRSETTLVAITDKLLFILYYVKAHPLQEILAFEFDMTQSTANEWIHLLSGVLKNVLEAGGHLPKREAGKFDSVLATVPAADYGSHGTERRRQRPKAPTRQQASDSEAKHTQCRIPDLLCNTKEQHDDLITEIACGLRNFRAFYKQS